MTTIFAIIIGCSIAVIVFHIMYKDYIGILMYEMSEELSCRSTMDDYYKIAICKNGIIIGSFTLNLEYKLVSITKRCLAWLHTHYKYNAVYELRTCCIDDLKAIPSNMDSCKFLSIDLQRDYRLNISDLDEMYNINKLKVLKTLDAACGNSRIDVYDLDGLCQIFKKI